MKVVAIVAEFNPLHNGHKFLIDHAKNIMQADYVIIIMSGDYVQRGAPAMFDKHTRAKMALLSGADLVLELPVHYSTASAEYFAASAVAMADKLGIVTHLLFGSECGSTDTLAQIADVLISEPDGFSDVLRENLKKGLNYPSSRQLALNMYFNERPEISLAAENPNNILGVEYIKALKSRHSTIIPMTVLRHGKGYHSNEITCDSPDGAYGAASDFASAQSIRRAICEGNSISFIKSQMPDSAFEVLGDSLVRGRLPITSNSFSLLLNSKLIENSEAGFEEYADVSSELSDRVQNQIRFFSDFEGFCETLKTKNMTHARISRALLHILLSLKKADFETFVANDYLGYTSVLGFRKCSERIFSEIKTQSKITLLSKNAGAENLLSDIDLILFKQNIAATQLYEAVLHATHECPAKNIYQTSPVIV